jgi:hypothetical protein
MSDRREEIDAAKVEAICNVLKTALPELVAIAFAAFKKTDEFAVGKLVTTLTMQNGSGSNAQRTSDARGRKFIVGDKVQKVGGDYTFVGVVVSVFWKRSGQVRYVVEDDRGILHIFSEKNLAPASWKSTQS